MLGWEMFSLCLNPFVVILPNQLHQMMWTLLATNFATSQRNSAWNSLHFEVRDLIDKYVMKLPSSQRTSGTLLLGYTLRVLVTSYQLQLYQGNAQGPQKRPLNFGFCKLSQKTNSVTYLFISLLELSLNYLTFQTVWTKVI